MIPKHQEQTIILADLPHLRKGGKWSKTGRGEKRMLFYINQLVELGMDVEEANAMMSDLYWDCYDELRANGSLK